ncbi:MAG: amidoligase family protein [Bacteroides sp.]|nr:amidoligase family protein [Eubacterium sp.]MCM1418890.1 amidoligase family protein [Roseburia sp.]MCM1463378.1 amidoligase family protein [Bacteroides sp.]
MVTIQTQNFGVEIEMTGITRQTAADVVAQYYGTIPSDYGIGHYDTYTAEDAKGRIWKAMRDSSIKAERKMGKATVTADWDYCCELVTPILQYEDIEPLQEIVRLLVKKGAIVNNSCGIHIHIDGANHTPQSLVRLLNFAVGRQELFNEVLGNQHRVTTYCKNTSKKLLTALKNEPEMTKERLEQIWYSPVNDNYNGTRNHEHYNDTRYHGINLHAFFTKGTVEFRLFNSTLHAGKIKAYIQFCLAMSAWAINTDSKQLFFKYCGSYTNEQKEKLMKGMLKRRLGMTGKEFKTARLHLTAAFRVNKDQTTAEETEVVA